MALEIPESVLKMVASFLGIDRVKAEQFVSEFHEAASKVIGNQDELVATIRRLEARQLLMQEQLSGLTVAMTAQISATIEQLPNGKDNDHGVR